MATIIALGLSKRKTTFYWGLESQAIFWSSLLVYFDVFPISSFLLHSFINLDSSSFLSLLVIYYYFLIKKTDIRYDIIYINHLLNHFKVTSIFISLQSTLAYFGITSILIFSQNILCKSRSTSKILVGLLWKG